MKKKRREVVGCDVTNPVRSSVQFDAISSVCHLSHQTIGSSFVNCGFSLRKRSRIVDGVL